MDLSIFDRLSGNRCVDVNHSLPVQHSTPRGDTGRPFRRSGLQPRGVPGIGRHAPFGEGAGFRPISSYLHIQILKALKTEMLWVNFQQAPLVVELIRTH